jgi:hypothetical protein
VLAEWPAIMTGWMCDGSFDHSKSQAFNCVDVDESDSVKLADSCCNENTAFKISTKRRPLGLDLNRFIKIFLKSPRYLRAVESEHRSQVQQLRVNDG